MFSFFKSNRQRFTHSIIRGWIISYMATLLIPIIFLTAFYYTSNSIVKKNFNHTNNVLIESIMQNIGNILYENTKNINFAASSKSVADALTLKNHTDGQSYYKLITLSKELSKYEKNLKMPKSVYIYLCNIDTVVDSKGIYSPRDFFDMNYSQYNIDYTLWLNSISKKQSNIIRFDNDSLKYNFFLSTHHFPVFSDFSGSAVIISHIENSSITLNLSAAGTEPFDVKYMVTDTHSNIILSSFNEKSLSVNDVSALPQSPRVLIDGKKYDTVIRQFDNNCSLICFFENSSYQNGIQRLNLFCLIVILITLIFGICIIIRYTKINYSPLENILNMLSNISKIKNDENEYDIIVKCFDKMKSENRSVRTELAKQNKILRSNFIIQLMNNNIVSPKIKDRNMKLFGIDLYDNGVIIMGLCVESYEALFNNMNSDIPDDEKYDTILFAVKNVLEEYISNISGNRAYTVDYDGDIYCLISFSDNSVGKECEQTGECADFIVSFFKSTFGVLLKIAFSDLKSVNDISSAFIQAKNAMGYAKINESRSIVSFNSLEQDKPLSTVFNQEINDRIAGALRLGNRESALKLIDELFDTKNCDAVNGLNIIKTNACNLITSISGLSKFSDAVHESTDVILCNIFESPDAGSIKSILTEIIKPLADAYEHNKLNKVSDNVIDYIENNYSNPLLGVATIADAIGFHRSYISTKFKEQVGMGINEYINTFRITKAKELLNTTNFTLNKISEQIGYNDSRTFIRIFKKYEDITPAKYRNINCNIKN